jgi:ATP-dependent Lon protease
MSSGNPGPDELGSLPSELDLPILAIRNTVIFPVLAFPINVGRDKSLKAVEQAHERQQAARHLRPARRQDRGSQPRGALPGRAPS